MKLIKFALIFVLVIFPFTFFNRMKAADLTKSTQLEMKYNRAIDTAVHDAAVALTLNDKTSDEARYTNKKYTAVNKKAGIQTFLDSISLNFDIRGDAYSQGTLLHYIPAVVIVEYDGFTVFALDDFNSKLQHVLFPKKPYAYQDDQGNLINFTLGDSVSLYSKSADQWFKGKKDDLFRLTGVELLNNPNFDHIRRQTIISALEDSLEYHINRHNAYAMRLGVTYTFTLPTISEEEWVNTVDDIGVLALIQGLPLGFGQEYNNFAFGGSRVLKSKEILAGEYQGIKYYYLPSDSFPGEKEKSFASKKEAAQEGYIPWNRKE